MEPYKMTKAEQYNILNDIVDNMMEAYDELDGAKKYIKSALKHKTIDKKMADRLVTMSAEELGHAESICEGIEAMLQKAENEKNECVAVMRNVWTHIYERMAGYKAWIKALHVEYKEM